MKLDPNLMRKLMKNIKMEEVAASEVIIKTDSGDIIISEPSVQRMKVKGRDTFQVSGEVIEEEMIEVSEEDLELVMDKTGCTEDEALEALGESEGDIAGAILYLKKQ
ncbi:nascent polypeptide-associated complex protein [archaeon]|nr:nascent polypeptide-associated complex protein [archaeon]